MFDITVTTSERLADWVGRQQKVAATAVRAGVGAATEGLKTDLRQRIEGAGLGSRLPNAVGSKVYPSGPSLGAAGSLFARGDKADKELTAFATGVTIVARNGGQYLLVPVNAPLVARARGQRRAATPEEVETQYDRNLRVVPLKSGRGFALVMDNTVQLKSGRGYRPRAARSRRQGGSIVMFLLLRQVSIRKRFDTVSLVQLWADRIPDLIDRALPGDL